MKTSYLDALLENIEKPPVLREAVASLKKVSDMDIILEPSDIIAGRYYYEPFDYRYGGGFVADNIDNWDVPESEKTNYYRKVAILNERLNFNDKRNYTQLDHHNTEAGLAYSIGWKGHNVFDYKKILQLGIPGIKKEIETFKKSDNWKNADFYLAMRLSLDTLCTYIKRYAQCALDTGRIDLYDVLSHILVDSPTSFMEALQLYYAIYQLDGHDTFGRIDYALGDYYERDIAAGIITKEYAYEVLKDIWLRITDIENMTIGGVDLEGRDITNGLTYLILELTGDLGRAKPNLCMRVHNDTPDSLWKAAIDCIGSGSGTPALYNDELIIPMLVNNDVALSDARNYAPAGCSQIMIPGKSNYSNDDGIFCAIKVLEIMLNGGIDPKTGHRLSFESPLDFASFEDFLEEFKLHLENALQLHRDLLDKVDINRGEVYGYPFRTLFTDNCLKTAKSYWGGGAKYNAIQSECVGITNLADSICVIKRLVFDDKSISLKDFCDILHNNWAGNEDLRFYIKKSIQKFGNANKSADKIAALVYDMVWSGIYNTRCSRENGRILPGNVVFIYSTLSGQITGATPDGRLAYSPLADSVGPSAGCDREGPTSMYNSVASISQEKCTTCAALNVKYSKDNFKGDFSKSKICAMLKGYFQMGGMQEQITVVDRDDLINAQLNPLDYSHIVVRVGGYSDNFVNLEKNMQDLIIERTAN